MFDLTAVKFSEEAMRRPPMIPKAISWLKFWLDSKLLGGIKPEQFVNMCNEDGMMLNKHSIQA